MTFTTGTIIFVDTVRIIGITVEASHSPSEAPEVGGIAYLLTGSQPTAGIHRDLPVGPTSVSCRLSYSDPATWRRAKSASLSRTLPANDYVFDLTDGEESSGTWVGTVSLRADEAGWLEPLLGSIGEFSPYREQSGEA